MSGFSIIYLTITFLESLAVVLFSGAVILLIYEIVRRLTQIRASVLSVQRRELIEKLIPTSLASIWLLMSAKWIALSSVNFVAIEPSTMIRILLVTITSSILLVHCRRLEVSGNDTQFIENAFEGVLLRFSLAVLLVFLPGMVIQHGFFNWPGSVVLYGSPFSLSVMTVFIFTLLIPVSNRWVNFRIQ